MQARNPNLDNHAITIEMGIGNFHMAAIAYTLCSLRNAKSNILLLRICTKAQMTIRSEQAFTGRLTS